MPVKQTLFQPVMPALVLLLFSSALIASPPEQEVQEPVEGLLPIPSYQGDLTTRAWLLGDLDGSRTDLANRGVQFGVESTQTLQSIVAGGRDEQTEFGGSLDYNLTLDLQKMGVAPGALVSMRAESRYGDTINSLSGTVLPVNVDGFFPLSNDDDVAMTVTALTFTQYLSPTFAVFLGKIDTLDGDLNEFASGRGVTQFQNAAFNFNPVSGLTVPYSTLAVGAIWLPTPQVTLSSAITNITDSSTTTGFDDIGEGWLWSSELSFQYRLHDLPGGQTVGVVIAGDSEFINLGSRLVFVPGEGLTTTTSNDSWYVSWNGWQYLWTEQPSEGPINLANRTPDLQGVGLFARAGFADKDTNPIDWSASVGLGGRGVIPGRDDDVFGIGYFYSSLQASRISGVIGLDDQVIGAEAFYNIALTPAAFLTLDGQVIEDALPGTDTTVILGMRLHVKF
jgi:porin